MKKFVVTLAILASAFQASAQFNYTSTTGCSEKNKPHVLFALDRMAQEKKAAGQEASAILALEAKISENSETQLSDQTLKEAGLNDQQVEEIKSILKMEE